MLTQTPVATLRNDPSEELLPGPDIVGTHDFILTAPVMGLDLSLTGTGICILRTDGTVLLWLVDPKKRRAVKRLAYIHDFIAGIFKVEDALTVGIEGYSFGSVNSHSHSTGELGGVVRHMLGRNGATMVISPPATLKKFICGIGNGEKSAMALHIYKRFGIEITQNDMADAYCAAVAAGVKQGVLTLRNPLPKPQLQSLDKAEIISAL